MIGTTVAPLGKPKGAFSCFDQQKGDIMNEYHVFFGYDNYRTIYAESLDAILEIHPNTEAVCLVVRSEGKITSTDFIYVK